MNNIRFHNDGPRGERDFEDGGSQYNTPRRPLSIGKAPTAIELNARRSKEAVIIARMVSEYVAAKGFEPNAIMMNNIRRDAALEAK